MPVICHGKGNPDTEGCCWVAGAPCPLRLKIVNDRCLQGPELVDVGSTTDLANAMAKGRDRTRAREHLLGIDIACRAAFEVVASNASLQTNRPAFNEAWNNHAEYVNKVRPHWAVIEENLGLPAGSYQCSTWRGTGRPECCFAEPESHNSSKAATLPATAVEVRRAGGA